MHCHEYQAKRLLHDYGVPVPTGVVISRLDELDAALAELGGEHWFLKAQVHAGGRGLAGGVRRAETIAQARAAAEALLGQRLVTPQTGPRGLPVQQVLIERPTETVAELYLGALVERRAQRVVVIAARAGGMDIEHLAEAHPEAIISVPINPILGLMNHQVRRVVYGLGIAEGQQAALGRIMAAVHRLFCDKDASLVEINPLAVTADGALLALDAKVTIDESALYRQPELAAMRDSGQEDPRERIGREAGFNYITLDGDIACMVNGAGLAMATMDLIKLEGGEPANFLDVGGGATAETVAKAFHVILEDTKVRAILVNIFGGIVRCDLIAEGIIQAMHEVQPQVPIVVRLEGTNAEQGLARLADSGLALRTAADLTEAARLAVAAATSDTRGRV